MLKRLTSVGACLVAFSGLALAQNKTYTVRAGDTLSAIAVRFNSNSAAITRANGLNDRHKLSLGQKLIIPSGRSAASASTSSSKTNQKSAGSYTVRNGDHDWALAKRFGTTVAKIHQLNPGVNWDRLQIGQSLRVPGGSSAPVAAKPAASKPVAVAKSGGYTVLKNDNDWIIARKVGTTPTKLRSVNPGVNWSRLQIGQKLNVPGSSAGTVASAPAIRSRNAVINTDGVTVRRKPSRDSSKVVVVSKSTPVTVLDHENGWYKLRFPRGTEGWVRGDYIKSIASTAVASNKPAKKNGSTQTANRRETSTMVAMNDRSTGSNSVLDKAASFKGIRYRYGGTSRSGFDCSGFTSTVYRANGVSLPRTSAQQATVGKAVSKGELRPGDLVFFRTRGSRRINHVGIYQGGGKFIHASSGGGRVQINSLNDGYYERRYAGARRVKNLPTKVSNTKPAPKKTVAVNTASEPAGTEHEAAPGTDTIVN